MFKIEASELKEYIIEKDLTIKVLEKLGCHKIKKNINDIRCALPNKTNGTSVSVRLDTLSTTVFSEGDKVSGDIITLVSHIKNFHTHSFINSLKWLHETCGLVFTMKKQVKDELPVNDPLALFRKIRCNNINNKYNNSELKIYDDSMLDGYIQMPHIELFREGISISTQRKFDISYCPLRKRIIFPYRYHYGDRDKYIGASGRTIVRDYDLLDIPKYMAIPPFTKGDTLYGYAESYEGIQKNGLVVVFEGEKSVMKVDTFGYSNAVSVGSHSITCAQKNLLLGLGTEICIAFDNDVSEKDIIRMCNEMTKFRRVSYIRDRDGILGDKDAPVDKGIKVYDKLLENRIRVN